MGHLIYCCSACSRVTIEAALALAWFHVEKNLVVVVKYSFSTLHQVYALVVDAVIKCGSIQRQSGPAGVMFIVGMVPNLQNEPRHRQSSPTWLTAALALASFHFSS